MPLSAFCLVVFCFFLICFIIDLLVGSNKYDKELESLKELEPLKTILDEKEISIEEVSKMFEKEWFLDMVEHYCSGGVLPSIPRSDGKVDVLYECLEPEKCLAFPDRCQKEVILDGKRYCSCKVDLTKLVCGEEQKDNPNLLSQKEINLLAESMEKKR